MYAYVWVADVRQCFLSTLSLDFTFCRRGKRKTRNKWPRSWAGLPSRKSNRRLFVTLKCTLFAAVFVTRIDCLKAMITARNSRKSTCATSEGLIYSHCLSISFMRIRWCLDPKCCIRDSASQQVQNMPFGCESVAITCAPHRWMGVDHAGTCVQVRTA